MRLDESSWERDFEFLAGYTANDARSNVKPRVGLDGINAFLHCIYWYAELRGCVFSKIRDDVSTLKIEIQSLLIRSAPWWRLQHPILYELLAELHSISV